MASHGGQSSCSRRATTTGFAGDDGLAGEAEEMAEALVVGDVRVHDEDEEGEEDIKEEADPGL